jgi:hypothetical protein
VKYERCSWNKRVVGCEILFEGNNYGKVNNEGIMGIY